MIAAAAVVINVLYCVTSIGETSSSVDPDVQSVPDVQSSFGIVTNTVIRPNF
jgi:hypothetical protein